MDSRGIWWPHGFHRARLSPWQHPMQKGFALTKVCQEGRAFCKKKNQRHHIFNFNLQWGNGFKYQILGMLIMKLMKFFQIAGQNKQYIAYTHHHT